MTWEEMTPRERDAWIAGHVMGWKRVKRESRKDYDAYRDCGGDIVYIGGYPEAEDYECDHPEDLWVSFVSDIAAAFSMEDKIKERGLHMEYANALVRLGSKPFNQTMAFDSIHASAEERCRAAYEVFNSL